MLDVLLKKRANKMVPLKHVVGPLTALLAISAVAAIAWSYSPSLVLVVVAALLSIAIVRGCLSKREDAKRGWRVGHIERDWMFYDELVGGSWERITIDGGMLIGKPHHVIYFPTPEEWEDMPVWAQGRQNEIVGRIKSAFTPPGYEYEEAEQGDGADV